MEPTIEERDALFRAFGRALFSRDLDALYEVVSPKFVWNYHDGEATTKHLTDRGAIEVHLDEQKRLYSKQRFEDVVYRHLPEETFMTFRVTEVVRETGEVREQTGIERYTFEGGKIALKEVYRKPLNLETRR